MTFSEYSFQKRVDLIGDHIKPVFLEIMQSTHGCNDCIFLNSIIHCGGGILNSNATISMFSTSHVFPFPFPLILSAYISL